MSDVAGCVSSNAVMLLTPSCEPGTKLQAGISEMSFSGVLLYISWSRTHFCWLIIMCAHGIKYLQCKQVCNK